MFQKLFLSALCLGFASLASADIVYQFNVDTSSVNGTAGSLDFEFNPSAGFGSQFANLSISSFTSDGVLSGPATIGDVSGTLPGTVLFDNGSFFNDYFTGFTYGNMLVFDVSLFGPALTSPDGTSTSGSAFIFSMFSDAAGTVPTLTTDIADGFAATINVNLDGTTTLNNFSTETTMEVVPEPATLWLIAGEIAILFLLRKRFARIAQR